MSVSLGRAEWLVGLADELAEAVEARAYAEEWFRNNPDGMSEDGSTTAMHAAAEACQWECEMLRQYREARVRP